MAEEDVNEHPASMDEGWKREERRYDRGGISAGKWLNWLVLVLVLAAVGYLAYGAAAAFFPRWWAEQVGERVGGSHPQGIAYGFGVGALFTFVPLLVFAQIRRRFFNWTWRLIITLFAVALALPNWLTVAVAIGTSEASVAGRTILTAEAPGFRNGSAAGAIAGLLLGLIVVATSMRLGHQRKKVRDLKGKLSELEQRNSGADDKPDAEVDEKPYDEPQAARGAGKKKPKKGTSDDSENERLAEPSDHATQRAD